MTAIEELIEMLSEYRDCKIEFFDMVERNKDYFLTREKEQREELIKDALTNYHRNMDMLQDPTVYNVSDELFNEVIKPKLNK